MARSVGDLDRWVAPPRPVSAEEAQRYLSDLELYLARLSEELSRKLCVSVERTSAQTITTNTWTAISFDSVKYEFGDGELYDSASPTRITARRAGVFAVTATVRFANNSTGRRYINFSLNGTRLNTFVVFDALAIGVWSATEAMQLELAEGDYLEVEVWQSSGGDLDVERALCCASIVRTVP